MYKKLVWPPINFFDEVLFYCLCVFFIFSFIRIYVIAVSYLYFWYFWDIDMYIVVLQVPHVNRTDYQLIDISEDGFVWKIFFFNYFLRFR